MIVKIRTGSIRFFIPFPSFMIGFVVRRMPERLFEDMRESIPEPYCRLITKEYFNLVSGECLGILKENKGLEIVHVEASDGTFVSIRL